tara:strand:+ start:280 stop:486 length:207 start_codon:yes stop_codon:yes gene_type:complete
MSDIFLDRLNEQSIRVQPKSVHGMLWLQTHFPDEHWEEMSIGLVAINQADAVHLSQDAELSGLRVFFP